MDAYAAAWLDSLPAPASSPHHAFSASHRDAMRPLHRQAAKPFRSMSRAARFALAAAVIAALLTAAVFSADMPLFRTLRFGLVTVYQQINPLYTEQHFETDVPDDGEMKTVTFGWLPEGMELTNEKRFKNGIWYTAVYSIGNEIVMDVFVEQLKSNASTIAQYDTENATVSETDINDNPAIMIEKGNSCTITLLMDNYIIEISTFHLSRESMVKIAENISLF